jgi:hypothetical protein
MVEQTGGIVPSPGDFGNELCQVDLTEGSIVQEFENRSPEGVRHRAVNRCFFLGGFNDPPPFNPLKRADRFFEFGNLPFFHRFTVYALNLKFFER